MRKHALTLLSLLSLALLAALFAASPANAQDYDQQQDQQDDPPSRVARLAFTSGAVSFQPAGTDDWVDATVNRPMTTGDKLWSDQGSRAALHIGSASINLSENTGFSFLNLTDNVAQLQLTAGTLRIRVKRLGDNENFEVDTPNLAFTILRPGIYRINVNESGGTTVIEDRTGQGEVTGGGSAYTLNAGDAGTFSGMDQLNADIENIGSDEDDFEVWCEQRDHHEDNSVSARYVSDDAIGYDDLDDNGGWRPTPEYGNVWFPHTAMVGWAPYHYGHWAYIAPWGYTWVDDAAWGFAPFHYGRWVTVGGAWGWVPCAPRPVVYGGGYGGAVYVRPVYAPALVAWVGGPHFGIGVAVGGAVGVGVGWFPLGPREVFVPSYHVSRNYVNNVNVSNTTVNTTVVNNYYNTVVVNKTVNVTNVTYVNQRVPGAVAATSAQAFTGGQSVSRNVVHVDASEVASAPVNAMTPAAVPQREAVLGGRTVVNVHPPAAIQARTVVVKTAPPPPPPSFAQRQQAIQSNGGRPISMAQARQIAPVRAQTAAAPQVRVAPPAKPATPQVVHGAKTVPAQTSANRPNNVLPPANPNRPPTQATTQPAANSNVQRPPTAHPANEQLEQQHQQQNENLNKQQDLERQKVEQQQQQENLAAQKQKADAAKQQQLQQQHEQQLQELQKQHQQQQQQLQQKQEQEHKQEQKQQAQPKEQQSKPKDDKPPKKDR
jgi:DNA segregation ATPase FtsK/SpoIIIE-like protein